MTAIQPQPDWVRRPWLARLRLTVELCAVGAALFLLFIAYGTLPNRWYHTLYVYSGSMIPAIEPGDVIIVTPPPLVFQPGMIVTVNMGGTYVTHRIIALQASGLLVTRGDANPVQDQWDGDPHKVMGLYRLRVPYMGYLVEKMQRLMKMQGSAAWFLDSASIPVEMHVQEIRSGTSVEGSLTAAGFTVAGVAGEERGVAGEVCATNRGSLATRGLSLLVQVEAGTAGPFQDLAGAQQLIAPEQQLAPGEQRCFPYRIVFQPPTEANLRVTAHITITNYAGWLPGEAKCPGTAECPFGPNPRADFSLIAATPTPTSTPTATPTPEPPTPIPGPCYLAEIEGGTGEALVVWVDAGQVFSLTWRFTNLGECAWTAEAHLHAQSDNLAGLPDEISLSNRPTAPGEQVGAALMAAAPLEAGEYRLHYQLLSAQDGAGERVEIRSGAGGDLVVILMVKQP